MLRLFSNSLFKASSWYIITNFFAKGTGFITLPIFTRLLSTSDYGVISLFNSWSSIFVIIISLNLSTSIGRAIVEFDESKDKYASSIIFLSIILFACWFLIFTIFKTPLINFTGLEKNLFFLCIIFSYSKFLITFFSNKLKFEYKYKTDSFLNIFLTVISVIFAIYLIKNNIFDSNYLGKIIGSNIFRLIVGIFLLIFILSKGKSLVEKTFWKFGLSFSIPLIMHNLSQIINGNFDRIIINKHLGESETGIYSFGYTLGMIIVVLFQSTSQAWMPWFYKNMEKENIAKIKKYSLAYRNFFTFAYVIILFVSPEIVRIMAPPEYWKGLYVIPWVFLAYYFQFLYSFEVSIELYYKKTSLISIATIFSALINITLNIIFIPLFGYIAAAITTTISYFFLFVFHFSITKCLLKEQLYGLVFYFKSILLVLIITATFLFIIDFMLLRMGIIIILIILFIKKYKFVFEN